MVTDRHLHHRWRDHDHGRVDYQDVVRDAIRGIVYTDDAFGINADTCAVMVSLDRQSPDIAQGVDDDKGLHVAQGAGDQGSCSATPATRPRS